MSTTQLHSGGFNLASGLSGFAIGAAATVLAFVAINPTAPASVSASDAGTITIPGLGDGGGSATTAIPQVGQTTTLANGTKVTRISGGQVQVTDKAGHTRVVTIAGSSGSAGRTIAGSAGTSSQTIGGSESTADQTVGGSAGSEGASGSANGSTQGGASGSGSASGTQGTGATSPEGCHGGATDTGVTATSVKLGATVAETGIATSFLGQARQGMEAYKNRVNAQGGVCGRTLSIKYVDDGWQSSAGQRNLENLINQDKVFALAVSPSSEGVNAASRAGTFAKAGIPVVGTNGLAASQYKDPYIWPVAAATVTLLHVMLQDAWDAGARNPAIVFDKDYRFGVEGANAFEKAFEAKSGKTIPGHDQTACGSGSRYCGITAEQSQGYVNEVAIVNNACKASGSTPACDYLVLLTEPGSALSWMKTNGAPTAQQFKAGIGAAQPLFTYSFGDSCGTNCNGMKVWTGYNPPLEQYANTPGVKQYVSDLKAQNSSADAYNQFTEGSYLGMQLLVDAMSRVGADLTRDELKKKLDETTLDTGLSAAAATWSSGQHWAIGGAQAFTMQAEHGFSGWASSTPFKADPWLGHDFG